MLYHTKRDYSECCLKVLERSQNPNLYKKAALTPLTPTKIRMNIDYYIILVNNLVQAITDGNVCAVFEEKLSKTVTCRDEIHITEVLERIYHNLVLGSTLNLIHYLSNATLVKKNGVEFLWLFSLFVYTNIFLLKTCVFQKLLKLKLIEQRNYA